MDADIRKKPWELALQDPHLMRLGDYLAHMEGEEDQAKKGKLGTVEGQVEVVTDGQEQGQGSEEEDQRQEQRSEDEDEVEKVKLVTMEGQVEATAGLVEKQVRYFLYCEILSNFMRYC